MKKYRAAWTLNDAGDVTNGSLFAYDTIDEALDVLKRKTRLPFGTKMWIEVIDDLDKENIVKLPVEKRLIVFENKGEKISRKCLADIVGMSETEPMNTLVKNLIFGNPDLNKKEEKKEEKKEQRTMEVDISECPRCESKAINIISYTNPRWVDKFAYCECDYCRLKSNEVKVEKDQSTEDVITAAYNEWNKMAERFNKKP